MKYLLITVLLVSIMGCSQFDKKQAINDCKFSEAKIHNSDDVWHVNNYVNACMVSKGYEIVYKETCGTYNEDADCWFRYTWRVFM